MTMNAGWLPDELPLCSLCPRMVCTVCGYVGADVRPDWSPHVNKGARAAAARMSHSQGNIAFTAQLLCQQNVKLRPIVLQHALRVLGDDLLLPL
jgi:hypothetical protein